MLIILILLVPLSTQAASLITNGSFEADGLISDITATPPEGWDANVPGNFEGKLTDEWASLGSYSVQLYSKKTDFIANDQAVVYQQVDFTDANEIIFDIDLYGIKYGYIPWDPNKVTAFVNIDNSPNDIWKSALNADGTYYDVNVPVDSYTGLHTLYLGIRVNVSEKLFEYYFAQWDFVKFDAYCGGFGYFDSDLNRDCYVDFGDLEIIGRNWLRDDLIIAEDYFDLDPDGYIDLFDFAVLANEWMQCTDSQGGGCVEVPLELAADINLDGIVNFLDYGILTANWSVPTDEKADIDGSGVVDYDDLKIMNAQWLMKSWLYEN